MINIELFSDGSHDEFYLNNPRKNSVPYMNRELRKAIYNKQMQRNKFEKYHTDKTWEAYRK
jgi:hypothetical protein